MQGPLSSGHWVSCTSMFAGFSSYCNLGNNLEKETAGSDLMVTKVRVWEHKVSPHKMCRQGICALVRGWK